MLFTKPSAPPPHPYLQPKVFFRSTGIVPIEAVQPLTLWTSRSVADPGFPVYGGLRVVSAQFLSKIPKNCANFIFWVNKGTPQPPTVLVLKSSTKRLVSEIPHLFSISKDKIKIRKNIITIYLPLSELTEIRKVVNIDFSGREWNKRVRPTA